MRAAWVVVIACACGASKPAATPHESVVHGHVSVAASVDAKLPRKGTLVLYWLTKSESELLSGTSPDLTALARLLDRLVVVGDVDLSRGPAEYSLPVARGDLVVSAMLDTQHDGIGNLLGAARATHGDLTGDGKLVHVDASAISDIELGQVLTAREGPEACAGANHELVMFEAPEVAGAMGNATSRRV